MNSSIGMHDKQEGAAAAAPFAIFAVMTVKMNRIISEAKFFAFTAHGAWKAAPEAESRGEATSGEDRRAGRFVRAIADSSKGAGGAQGFVALPGSITVETS